MRKVLHLRTISGKGGGPEKTILNSPVHIGPDYDMRLAFLRPQDDPAYDIPQRAARLGVRLIDLPERSPLDWRAVRQLCREVRDFRPDLLHPHDYKTNLLAVLVGRWYRIPVVTTMHGYVVQTAKLRCYYQVDKWSLRRMAHVVVVSRDLYDIARQIGIPSERCTLIHNAIDTEANRRSETIAEAKARQGVAADRLVIGAVGRLSPEKGFDLLIRAVAQLLKEGVDAELWILGEGDERAVLEALIQSLGCGDRIRLLGHRSDAPALYQAMDVFVLSSLREGLPNVVLEAMAFEVPTIATRIAGVPDLIRHEESGLLIAPGEQDELDAALRRLLIEAPEERQRFGQAGRATVEREFDFRQRMRKMRKIYDRVLGPLPEPASVSPAERP